MACVICSHPKRAEIESALAVSEYGSTNVTLKEISDEFGVSLKDLQVHVLMHSPLTQIEQSEPEASLAAGIKKSEANMLSNVAQEYFVTLKATGREIRSIMQEQNTGGSRTLNKAVVDLYIGTGNNIRQTMESLMEMNQKLNGETDAGTQALVDLVTAIRKGPST